ncbi:LPXTG cell wall anchor domain-containing protein, partial [Staphylococcus aureus]|uniref:LPXTG cell wall anchor domain-containing protein n=1 Tax=Staphylococcus aureus TaxID=1280 RepID=UPI0037A1F1AD
YPTNIGEEPCDIVPEYPTTDNGKPSTPENPTTDNGKSSTPENVTSEKLGQSYSKKNVSELPETGKMENTGVLGLFTLITGIAFIIRRKVIK